MPPLRRHALRSLRQIPLTPRRTTSPPRNPSPDHPVPRVLPVLALLVCAAPALFGAPGAARPPRTAEERRAALDATERKLADLVETAKQDPRTAKVRRYLTWSRTEDFTNPKRDVFVKDLVEWLKDEDAPASLRDACRDALKSITQRSVDPDLSIEEGRNRRAAFSREKLIPMLTKAGDKAESTRAYAAEILESYWHFAEPDIARFNPKDDATWAKAAAAYRNRLRGK